MISITFPNKYSFSFSIDHNDPPTAVAGKDQTVYLPSRTISIDGSKSHDDGLIDAFKWIRTGLSPAAGVNIPFFFLYCSLNFFLCKNTFYRLFFSFEVFNL